MPSPDTKLLELAREQPPSDRETRDCWELVLRGIELGWIDSDELRELITSLQEGHDYGVEELLFAFSGDRLRVSFLRQTFMCSPATMIDELSRLNVAV